MTKDEIETEAAKCPYCDASGEHRVLSDVSERLFAPDISGPVFGEEFTQTLICCNCDKSFYRVEIWRSDRQNFEDPADRPEVIVKSRL